MENVKKKILCVDDDNFMLNILRQILQKEYAVDTVRSGKEALGYLVKTETTPDLILLDIIMPEMDGWETLNKIRGVSSLKDIPIIFVTSLDSVMKEQVLIRGGEDFIRKPVDAKELLIKIKMALKNREAVRRV